MKSDMINPNSRAYGSARRNSVFVPDAATYTILAEDSQFDTGADANFFIGGLVHSDSDGELTATVDSDNNSNSKVSVLTPIGGTMVKFVCDGLNWYLNGHVVSATNTAVVFADQS